jgi:hypothetical protein
VTEREEKADTHWALTLLHQFTSHIVDRGDVIGIYRMSQTK